MDERDRKHPEAAAGRLDGAYDRLPVGVVRCLAGETLRILAVNRVFLEMLGEAETLPVCDEDAASLREAFEHCEENGTFYREVRMTERFGKRIWVRCDGTREGSVDGKPVVLLTVVNITDRKQDQAQMEERQREYELVVGKYAEVMFEYWPDRDELISRHNSGDRVYTHRLSRYMETLDTAGIVHPEDVRAMRNLLTGVTRQAEIRTRYPDQSAYTWVDLQAEVLRHSGRIYKVVGALRNISDIRAKELEFRRLERDSQIFTASLMALFGELIVLDLKTGHSYVKRADDAAVSVLSVGSQGEFEVENRQYGLRLIHPDDQPRFFDFSKLDNIRRRIERGERRFSTEVRRKNGSGVYRWCELLGIVIDNEGRDNYNVLLTFRDIHDLRVAQQQKREADRRFMAAVNNFYDGIYECELCSKRVKSWKSARGLLGMGAPNLDSLENWHWFVKQVHPDYQERSDRKFSVRNIVAAFRGGAREVSMELPCLCTDGSYRWLAIQVQHIGGDPECPEVMAYIKDIDAKHREEAARNEKLKEALKMAEESNHAKSDFLSRMSHDIRTPMNVIIGMSEIAESSLDDRDRVSDCLKKIHVSAQFLLSLINDVLDMSKIESGKLTINTAPFSLRELLDDVSVLCSGQAKMQGQQFHIRLEECDGAYVGDALRLKQILMNLLGNAVKFTPSGGNVSLAVTAEQPEDDRMWLKFTVKDSGIGMSPEFLERLFTPFEQEQSGGGRVFEGTGLGLAITHKLVEMMGGRITVSSKQGEGSEFQVILPFARSAEGSRDGETAVAGTCGAGVGAYGAGPGTCGAGTGTSGAVAGTYSAGPGTCGVGPGTSGVGPGTCGVGPGTSGAVAGTRGVGPATRGADTANPSPARFSGETILLVEDNDLNREIARTLLMMAGLSVEEAADGREAVERFAASAPGDIRAILMDIRMPVMDGLEATRRIRAMNRPDAQRIPVIAMTANAFYEEQADADAAGLCAYLTKPVEPERLYRTLEFWLNHCQEGSL